MLRLWRALTWYGKLMLVRKIVDFLFKRLRHLLFDDHYRTRS